MKQGLLPGLVVIFAFCQVIPVDCVAASDKGGLPSVPPGFVVSVFATEPLVRNPCAMAFDLRGRLFVGQGPQYRKPQPDTPGDRVTLLFDLDADGVADKAHTFAEGFNSIQGLAWRGDELWIANAPDLTVVRDVDGDDVADEYRRIYGGLGNLEHGLHGLVFAPDNRLYMSKGNSRGYNDLTSPERYLAPAAFTDLWGMPPVSGAPQIPESKVDSVETYRRGYHKPSDDWGTEGGVLRCRPDGSQIEVYSRGMRNLWDLDFDSDFNWVGTDQDQDGGDRILNPFAGAHFGWGHPWSPHWTGEDHLPSVPISGPVYHGSGTGVVYGASSAFPERYRHLFFCADWLSRSVFLYRPQWDGASMRNMEPPEVFVAASNGRTMGSSEGMLFDPTDLQFGPDGALWVLSWGHGYGAEMDGGEQRDAGRVFRITWSEALDSGTDRAQEYATPPAQRSVAGLLADLRQDVLPVRRTTAQAELLRRGHSVRDELVGALSAESRAPGAETWLLWTLGLLNVHDSVVDELLAGWLTESDRDEQKRIQLIRVIAERCRLGGRSLPEIVSVHLTAPRPRIRMAAAQAVRLCGESADQDRLWKLLEVEQDRAVFYAARRAVDRVATAVEQRQMLRSAVGQVRLAALLNLLERAELSGDEVMPLQLDTHVDVAATAASFLQKVGTSTKPVIRIDAATGSTATDLRVELRVGEVPAGLHVRYTTDGSEPTDTTGLRYERPFVAGPGSVIAASLFRERERMGPVLRRSYRSLLAATAAGMTGKTLPIAVEAKAIEVESGAPYGTGLLISGQRAYENRNYRWRKVPSELEGHTILQARNDDADVGSQGNAFLSFDLAEPADVYVAHDVRIQQKPEWLSDFELTDLQLSTSDTSYGLYVQRMETGRVNLGGNTLDGGAGGRSQYFAILRPAPLQPVEMPTTIAATLDHLGTADFRRGARLFYEQAGCARCHRMGSRGQAFAPNLTNMGTRAAPATLAESILKPSAVIMEGFHTVTAVTVSGQAYHGFVRQESGLAVDLVQANGELISIPRVEIEERIRQPVSAMPDGLANQLNPQQTADLIRFVLDAGQTPSLLATVSAGPTGKADELSGSAFKPGWSSGRGSGIPADDSSASSEVSFDDTGSSLRIRVGRQQIGEYVYRHDRILRPFFAHMKTPLGPQVTRTFPPGEGDRQDHADMHPGIWLAFGDISGVDFWRNQGVVRHQRFLEDPTGGDGEGRFRELKRYLNPSGDVVCREEFGCVVRVTAEGYVLEFTSEFFSDGDHEFSFGDQEEMGLGIRVATKVAEIAGSGGRILDSEGRTGAAEVWSNASRWCDYSGISDGRVLGMTILCHPENLRQSWMHARDYGVIAANLFGRKAMRKGDASRIVVRPGETFRLRYAVLLHNGEGIHEQAYRKYLRRTEIQSESTDK